MRKLDSPADHYLIPATCEQAWIWTLDPRTGGNNAPMGNAVVSGKASQACAAGVVQSNL